MSLALILYKVSNFFCGGGVRGGKGDKWGDVWGEDAGCGGLVWGYEGVGGGGYVAGG